MRYSILVLPVLVAFGCTSATSPRPDSRSAFDGPVLTVEARPVQTGTLARVLVQAEPPGRWTGRIWVSITAESRLLWHSGAPAKVSDVAPGSTVSVWTRVVLESDPAQAHADTVVIERPAAR